MPIDIAAMKSRIAAKADGAHRSWYRIQAAADVAEVWIYDEISWWGVSAATFVDEIRGITAPRIVVHINSPGGDAFDGVAIMTALRSHPAHVTTRTEGLAASAASIIFQGGDSRVMVQHATLMIHEAWGGCVGPAADMRAFADVLDKLNDTLAAVYAERSGKHDAAHFRDLMAVETWLSDAEAVELGLADEVFVQPRKDAPAASSGFLPPNAFTLPAGSGTFTVPAAVMWQSDLVVPAVADAEPPTPSGAEHPAGGSPVTEAAAASLLAALTSPKEGTPDE
jgi:ATP-dependent protease ClpP protease subunit